MIYSMLEIPIRKSHRKYYNNVSKAYLFILNNDVTLEVYIHALDIWFALTINPFFIMLLIIDNIKIV